mmetsp:Transcript_11100/g.32654  ORF Transcript_11100/g.32654 Transcript_11100/m.32654 type:complete len:585 (+) Transcript_11100:66-1820(+)
MACVAEPPCLADPSASTVSLAVVLNGRHKPAADESRVVCAPDASLLIAVQLSCSGARPACSGGDIVHVDVAAEHLRASPHVRDHGNGTYTSALACSVFGAERRGVAVTVAARLVMQLRRPALPPRLWNSPRQPGFRGWDELALFDNLFPKKSRNKTSPPNLRGLHQCVENQLIGGRAVRLRVGHEPAAGGVQVPACGAGDVRSPHFARCDGRLSRESHAAMNLGLGRDGTFDHCIYGLSHRESRSCSYAYLRTAEVHECLRGRRLLLLGDSVTTGMYRDLLSMFGRDEAAQLGATRYPGACPDNRTEAELDAAFPKSASSFLRGEVELMRHSITLSRVGLSHTLAHWETLYAPLLRERDIVLIESARHDISPPRETVRLGESAVVKPRLIAEYRRQVNELAARIRQLVDAQPPSQRTVVVWRSPQLPYSWGCPLLDTHNPPLLEVLSDAGSEAFRRHGFLTVDVLGLTKAAVDPSWWYYTSRGWQLSDWRWVYRAGKSEHVHTAFGLRGTTELHTHESSTTESFRDAAAREGCTAGGAFPHEARVYGWLSRAATQLTLNRVCAHVRTTHRATAGHGPAGRRGSF